MGYTKLFSTIVGSTIWRENAATRIVWVTMLAMADEFDVVEASVPGLADLARVSLDECIEAIRVLSSPDEWSRTKDHEGRRIKEVDGGWLLLNRGKYREMDSADDRRAKNAERQRRFRERKAKKQQKTKPRNAETVTTVTERNDVTRVTPSDVEVNHRSASKLADVPSGGPTSRFSEFKRQPGQPPSPRKDPLNERLSFSRWFPSKQWLEWFDECGLTDKMQDQTMAEARDKLTGSHDIEWWDMKILRFFEAKIKFSSRTPQKNEETPWEN